MCSCYTRGGAMSDTREKPVEDLNTLIEGNPHVDRDQFRETQELLRELADGGVPQPGYEIASPYERHPVRHTP